MKLSKYYIEKGISDGDSLNYFKSKLTTTNKNENYLNDWQKIRDKINSIIDKDSSIKINNLINNSKDIEKDFLEGIKNKLIPMTLVRQMLILSNKESSLIVEISGTKYTLKFKNKKKNDEFSDEEIETIKKILISQDFFFPIKEAIPNFNIDAYLLYTSIGMDTNSRKNRSGTNYENKIKGYISDYCNKHNLYCTFHFNSEFKDNNPEKYNEIINKIKGIKKIPDFLIFSEKNTYLIETNYSDGGSKLQETIKAYIDLQKRVDKHDNLEFIYITDGKQWSGNISHLNEAWNEINYIINYNMLNDNVLDFIIDPKENTAD